MGPVAYIGLCLLGCLVFNPSLAAPGLSIEAQAASCLNDSWLSWNENCYLYFPKKENWEAAEAECKKLGNRAHLASIHSAGENSVLAYYVKTHHNDKSAVWIGLSHPKENLNWRWADKCKVDFFAWEKWQPDNLKKNEYCVAFGDHADFQQWHDYPCGDKYSFVCEQKGRLSAPGGSRRLVFE